MLLLFIRESYISTLPPKVLPRNLAAASAFLEFFSGQQINKTLVDWEAQIPSVNTGAFSAEAQSALLAVTPNILNGSDLDTELAAAEEQFNQTIQ